MIWRDNLGWRDAPRGHPGDLTLNRLGSWLGAMTQATVADGPEPATPASDLLTAEHLGPRVAATAHRWVHGRIPNVAVAA